MGYYISTPWADFSIATNDIPRFFDIVANLMSDTNLEENGNGGSWEGGKRTAYWYSWVNTEDVRKAVAEKDIVKVFECWGYDLWETSEHDGITHYRIDIRNGDAKIGDEEKFFAAIAPIVVEGSFIDCTGEDGAQWRWLWENGKFYVQDVIRKEVHYGEPNEIYFEDANKRLPRADSDPETGIEYGELT